jgi:diguanylate cyclase (GGDEF)-like protein
VNCWSADPSAPSCSSWRRCSSPWFLDLDWFKTVNDSLGHTVGDVLLVAIASRLHAVLRPADTIARLGGDEFAILVDDVTATADVVALAERVLTVFDSAFRLDTRDITIRCSIGVVLAVPDITPPTTCCATRMSRCTARR